MVNRIHEHPWMQLQKWKHSIAHATAHFQNRHARNRHARFSIFGRRELGKDYMQVMSILIKVVSVIRC